MFNWGFFLASFVFIAIAMLGIVGHTYKTLDGGLQFENALWLTVSIANLFIWVFISIDTGRQIF